jgi:outer membrane protein N
MSSSNRLYFVPLYCSLLWLHPQMLCAEPAAPVDQEDKPAEKEKAGFTVTEKTRDRELDADEDPMAREQSDLVEKLRDVIVKPDELRAYGSVRIRYRETDADSFWGDGGSRFGISGRAQFKPKYWLLGRVEAGINLLDTADLVFNRGDRPPGSKIGDEIFQRLLYLGIETPDINVTAGKNWSTYYRVSSFTDRFQGTGASASGTFNAGTDGGYTGTGRADRVIQTRGMISLLKRASVLKPLNLNFQVQHGRPIPTVPDKNYKTTIGLSSVQETDQGVAIGLAFNYANIDSGDLPELNSVGIDGDATAAIIGARWYGDDWYLGTVLARLKNHENTDQAIFFDGTGWELYAQYNLHKQWWAVGGWNKLRPDGSETQAGAYNIDYGVIGLRYSFQGFRQMIFANVRLESSTLQDSTELGNVYTIGVRWDLP